VESIRYLALGDSYTIGTGLEDEAQNFPSLLAGRLRQETGIDVAVTNLGVNGYTTTDLIREELPVARTARPELVSILIGANDVVQGSDDATYRARLTQIYEAVKELGLPPERVLAVSIPDFSPLPGAAPFGSPSHLRGRIDAFNDIAREEATFRGFQSADITAISRETNRGDDWLASDGLHPGPAQHSALADHLWETATGWRSVGFDRWSNPATLVLAGAQGEAEALHHSYIGAEHVLLGLLKDKEGVGGKLLSHWRVSYERVWNHIDRTIGKRKDVKVQSTVIPSTRVRNVIRIASQEASSAGADFVGTEHILLAILAEGESIAVHILSDLSITRAIVRTELDRRLRKG